MADSTTHVLPEYHRARFHPHLHKPTASYKVVEFLPEDFSLVSAAIAAHGTSSKWEHLEVVPLADADEIHVEFSTPHDMDTKFPFYVRWKLIANAAAKGVTITTTYDTVDCGANHTGSDDAGEPATAFTETIAAIGTTDNPGADKPFFSVWGKVNGATTDFDSIHIKGAATDATTTDAVRVRSLQFAYRPLTA